MTAPANYFHRNGVLDFAVCIGSPAWNPPARIDFWTWEIDAQTCHCRVRIYRDGRREHKVCSGHGWVHILAGEERLLEFANTDSFGGPDESRSTSVSP